MRAISTNGMALPSGTVIQPGPAPTLQWIAIDRLRVDGTYQRAIRGEGLLNVRRIAQDFRWSRFAPVVISQIESGLYAIVDGQHRATAAKLAGISEIPCQIIVATPREQAEAFAAINGNVTRIHKMALHRAAVAAGDREALAINAVAKRAGVTILPYPKSELNQEPGETMAIGTIAKAMRAHGEARTVLALRCIVETRNKVKGGLIAPVIAGTVAALAKWPKSLLPNDPQVIAAFEKINLIREYGKAQITERAPGTAIWTILARRIDAQLNILLRTEGCK